MKDSITTNELLQLMQSCKNGRDVMEVFTELDPEFTPEEAHFLLIQIGKEIDKKSEDGTIYEIVARAISNEIKNGTKVGIAATLLGYSYAESRRATNDVTRSISQGLVRSLKGSLASLKASVPPESTSSKPSEDEALSKIKEFANKLGIGVKIIDVRKGGNHE